ncbi:c2h2 finger domain-containing protein [Ophiostoma piceae UAMH 11346]|uniref:C2h2 finger domain-containing protein n=1 Tax=Ophiostoma piceae (strain UAMH 11346) TaxID=1262450 RepID=S3C0J0_OPHP1|nr:c2h2 finger domain-containing protein [Ophiostoma piceae UAMH 11346]
MPLEQARPQPPRPPSTNAYQGDISQWLGRPGQGSGNPLTMTGAPPSTSAPPAGLLQGPAQIQNTVGHHHIPIANPAPGRMVTNIPPPMPPYSGQSTTNFSSPASNGHLSLAQSIPQTPLIPSIPQQSQPRPAHISHNLQPPLHSPVPPPSVPPSNGVTSSAASIPAPHGLRAPSSQPRPSQDWAGVRGLGAGPINPPPPAKALTQVPTRAPTSASTPWPPFRQHTATGFSDMDVDELANTDDDDPVPLIISDLDPRFGKTDTKSPKSSPSSRSTINPSLRPPSSQTQREMAPLAISLRAMAPTTAASHSFRPPTTPSPQRQPIVSIALARPPTSPTHSHRPPPQPQYHAATSKPPAAAASVSVSIPSYSSKDSATGKTNDSISANQLPTLRPPTPQTKSPGGSVGRRTNNLVAALAPSGTSTIAAPSAAGSGPQVQIKGGRPKGWKPGMSYREVALRNLGVDTSDPALPPDFLMARRHRRASGKPDKRPIGRPRLHGSSSASADANAGAKKPLGRPRLHKTAKDRIMHGKRIGRPPLQTVEEVQRAIFHDSTVRFVPFKCEWAGCRAELHNLATLRRHVEFVHGRGGRAGRVGNAGKAALTAGPPTCLWRKCATREPPIQFRSDHFQDDREDKNLKTFLEHMEYHHFEPLSWHQGDGFANNSHLGPPPTPASIVLAEKEADIYRKEPAADAEYENAEQYRNCATTAALDMAIRVPTKYVPGYLLEDGWQVTPLLRDPILQVSSAFWSADERARRIKEAYRQQNRRPERGWTG